MAVGHFTHRRGQMKPHLPTCSTWLGWDRKGKHWFIHTPSRSETPDVCFSRCPHIDLFILTIRKGRKGNVIGIYERTLRREAGRGIWNPFCRSIWGDSLDPQWNLEQGTSFALWPLHWKNNYLIHFVCPRATGQWCNPRALTQQISLLNCCYLTLHSSGLRC